MSSKRYTGVQTDKGRVIFDNVELRYVSSTATGAKAAPALTADINKAEVWSVLHHNQRVKFSDVLKELNKQPWLSTSHNEA